MLNCKGPKKPSFASKILQVLAPSMKLRAFTEILALWRENHCPRIEKTRKMVTYVWHLGLNIGCPYEALNFAKIIKHRIP